MNESLNPTAYRVPPKRNRCADCQTEIDKRRSYFTSKGLVCRHCHGARETRETALLAADDMGISYSSMVPRTCAACAAPTLVPIEVRHHRMRVNFVPIPTGTSVNYRCQRCGGTVRLFGAARSLFGIVLGVAYAALFFSRADGNDGMFFAALGMFGVGMVALNVYRLLQRARHPVAEPR